MKANRKMLHAVLRRSSFFYKEVASVPQLERTYTPSTLFLSRNRILKGSFHLVECRTIGGSSDSFYTTRESRRRFAERFSRLSRIVDTFKLSLFSFLIVHYE